MRKESHCTRFITTTRADTCKSRFVRHDVSLTTTTPITQGSSTYTLQPVQQTASHACTVQHNCHVVPNHGKHKDQLMKGGRPCHVCRAPSGSDCKPSYDAHPSSTISYTITSCSLTSHSLTSCATQAATNMQRKKLHIHATTTPSAGTTAPDAAW